VIWLNPAAWIAWSRRGPILIHIWCSRGGAAAISIAALPAADTLASIRRHVLEDLPLLAIRAAILAAAWRRWPDRWSSRPCSVRRERPRRSSDCGE